MDDPALQSVFDQALANAHSTPTDPTGRPPGCAEIWPCAIEGVPCDALVLFEARADGFLTRATCLAMLLDRDKGIALLFGQGLSRAEWREPAQRPAASALFNEAMSQASAAASQSAEFAWRRDARALGDATPEGEAREPARL